MDDTVQKSRRSRDIQQAELERRKRDLYKVFNPTNQDHQVTLNAAISPEVWVIKSKEEAIVPNYVRVKYFVEMTDKIIYSKSDKAVIAENEKRMSKGFDKMNLHTEQMRFESRNLKNLMGKREKIVAVLDRGLYKEYGIGDTVTPIDKRRKREDFDPGDVFNDDNVASPTSHNAPQNDSVETKATPIPLTHEEQIKQQRIANMAKARAAKEAKNVSL